MTLRVLITGASPDGPNRNVLLRSFVAAGFVETLGPEAVRHAPLELAGDIARAFKPGIVLCFGSCMPDDADYSDIRRACDAIDAKLVFWLHDDPYEFDFGYRAVAVADAIFSNDRWASLHYDHPNAHHLPLAADRDAHWRPLGGPRDFDVFFCGVAFPSRVRLLKDLAPTLAKLRTRVLGDEWPKDALPFARNQRLPNDALSTHYSRARLTLNMGRDFHYANERFRLEPSTPGPRTFEAAMAGTTQLYFVESLEIEDYYAPDTEIVLYDSATEFARHAAALLADEAGCTGIAAAAQARTLADHTYAHRARRLLEMLAVAPIPGEMSHV